MIAAGDLRLCFSFFGKWNKLNSHRSFRGPFKWSLCTTSQRNVKSHYEKIWKKKWQPQKVINDTNQCIKFSAVKHFYQIRFQIWWNNNVSCLWQIFTLSVRFLFSGPMSPGTVINRGKNCCYIKPKLISWLGYLTAEMLCLDLMLFDLNTFQGRFGKNLTTFSYYFFWDET